MTAKFPRGARCRPEHLSTHLPKHLGCATITDVAVHITTQSPSSCDNLCLLDEHRDAARAVVWDRRRTELAGHAGVSESAM
jgi:hypothetical protein